MFMVTGTGCNITQENRETPRRPGANRGPGGPEAPEGTPGEPDCYNLGLCVQFEKNMQHLMKEENMQNGKPYSHDFNSPLEEAASFAQCILS